MLLEELISTKYKERVSSKPLSDSKTPYYSLGHGRFGYAVKHKSDDAIVKKVVRRPRDDLRYDGYYTWITGSHKLANQNPYIPRVYNITVFKDTDGQKKYKIDMEKLIPLTDLTDEDYEIIAKKISPDLLQAIRDPFNKDKRASVIANFLAYRAYNIKDDDLKDALALIDRLTKRSFGHFSDIHYGNVMVRRTKFGPQLVFVDPIADDN